MSPSPEPWMNGAVLAPSDISNLKTNLLPFRERGGVGIPLFPLSLCVYFYSHLLFCSFFFNESLTTYFSQF